MTGRNRWFVGFGVVAIAAAVVLTVVLVSGGSEESASAGRPPATTARPKPTVDPLDLAGEPAWTSDVRQATGADARDGLAVVYGAEDLALIDIATGDTRWAVEAYEELPDGDGAKWKPSFYGRPWLVDHSGEPAVLTEYLATECADRTGLCPESDNGSDQSGLVLLSAEDGGVIWRVPLLPEERGGEDDGYHDVWAVDDELVLVHVAVGPLVYGDEVDIDALRAVAIDLRSGDTLWERPRWFPVAVTGDSVIGVTSGMTPDPRPMMEIPEGTVGALDRRTGKPKWDLGERYDRSQVIATAGTVAVVRGQAGGAAKMDQVVVAADSGEVLTDIGTAIDSNCASDGESLIACVADDGIETVDPAGEKVAVIDDPSPASISAVWLDRIVLRDGHQHVTIDRAGNQIDKDLPGPPVAMTGDHVLFLVGDTDSRKVSCYRLGG